MAKDYYKILGVARGATKEEISKAYRAMARKYHPDLHADDKSASKKFQEVQQAFEVLNDDEKRKQYDQYGENFEHFGQGAGPGGGFRGGFRGGAGPQWGPGAGAEWQNINFDDIFRAAGQGAGAGAGFDPGMFGDFTQSFRGSSGGGRRRRTPSKGNDIKHDIAIPFTESITGGKQEIRIQETSGVMKTVTATIPAGIEDGKKLRLRGLGENSLSGGPAGDLVLIVHVTPHSSFSRQDNNLILRLPVTIAEATLGAKVSIPTPRGSGVLNIPPGTSSGKKLRVKGAGVPSKNGTGDLLVEILVNVPKTVDEATEKVLRELDQNSSTNLRAGISW